MKYSLPNNIETFTEPTQIAPYAQDEAFKKGKSPIAVLFPKDTSQVQEILKLARREKIAIIPRGAGSGLAGGAVPISDAFVVSLERMNHILEISEEDCVAVVEPGVITGEIRKAVEAKGLFYPPIPASVDYCTIGGNVSTNAGGLCAVKYGVTREYILGLEVVLMDGSVIQTGGRITKNSTGYNLTQLIVGSEGTLGIVTKIILKLLPLPRERMTILVPFGSLQDMSATVVNILSERIIPPTLELIPRAAVEAVLSRHNDLSFPFPTAVASLLIELDGRTGTSIENDMEALEPILAKHASAPPAVAANAAQRDELWTLRKLVRDSIAGSGDYEEADSVVPRKNFPDLVTAAEEVGLEFGLSVIAYGHAGDGNLHTYFRRGSTPDGEWEKKSQGALKRFLERTIALGGMLSGEHGIGFLKRDYMPLAFSHEQLDLMRRLKNAFDPDNLLNPGKVLPV